MKDVGIAPLDVLRWATKHGAEAMGRGHELGSVAPGKLADLVVVDGDPSVDIAVLQDAQQAPRRAEGRPLRARRARGLSVARKSSAAPDATRREPPISGHEAQLPRTIVQ